MWLSNKFKKTKQPFMSMQNTLFYRKNQEINYNFSAEEISSDGGIYLAEKIEKQFNVIKSFCKDIADNRHQSYVSHSLSDMVKQRVFLMIQGYEDCNDHKYLKNDPVVNSLFENGLASQPTLSRFENSLSFTYIYEMSLNWIERYVSSIDPKRQSLVIDIDATDDPTHGKQQLSMFNGYYEQFMYNELLFHDGETGQVILPVLRPGNSHSNRWFVHILSIIVEKIREKYPNMEIIIRADGGFSCSEFYKLADEKNLKFCIGLSKNKRLEQFTQKAEKAVELHYVDQNEKYQFFTPAFEYQAKSWHKSQNCYAKVESTGKGMNIRYFCSNIDNQTARQIYWDFYVKRGETSENRIKELKNMCFSDRLSCHGYVANYFRLFLSCLCYEFFRIIKILIKKSGDKNSAKWQVSSIRLFLMKVGARIKIRVRRITLSLSASYVCRKLFDKIVALC